MNLKRIIYRSRKYYSEGVSLVGLPITFLGFSRSLYNLIDNLPVLNIIFPTFQRFLLIGGLGLIPFSILIGYVWIKSPFYKQGVAVGVENNPYAWQLAPGRDSILYFGQVIGQRNMHRLFKKLGTITREEDELYEKYVELMEQLDQGGIIT